MFFKPKEIESGDFYLATENNHKFYIVVCDSKGHCVLGAFMSLLNMGFLNEAIKEKNFEVPAEIFEFVKHRLITTIGKDGQRDGMDSILLKFEVVNDKLHIDYAAENNTPVLIRNNNIIELQKDKLPVGKGEKQERFNPNSFNVNKGDTQYL